MAAAAAAGVVVIVVVVVAGLAGRIVRLESLHTGVPWTCSGPQCVLQDGAGFGEIPCEPRIDKSMSLLFYAMCGVGAS